MSARPHVSHRELAVAQRGPAHRPIVSTSRAVAVIDGRGAVSARSISLPSLACLARVTPDDVDPHRPWTGRRLSADRIDVTAAFCGDPGPGRSALDMRGRG